jgi:hypothetical protein
MKNFGKYAIVSDVKHVFEQEPEWFWTIRPPTSKDEMEVSKVLSTDRTRVEGDGTRVTRLTTTLEVAVCEIAVTFGGTNIPTSETDANPILKAGASRAEVEAILMDMPRAMVLEIWNAVGDAVPGWGPVKQKAVKLEETAAKN